MSWLQLELALPRERAGDLEQIEEALFAEGALSITLLSESDEPVLEPAPGEVPLWQLVRVRAVFDVTSDLAPLRATLSALKLSGWEVSFVGDEDWSASIPAVEMVFADRLYLRPPLGDGESRHPDLINLEMQPGMAFGSGTHPTTRLCLAWLAEHIVEDAKVLDFGCGSGILAIGAALMGAIALGVDYDPQAVVASDNNADRNGLSQEQVSWLSLEAWQAQEADFAHTFDVVVANILAEPLKTLADKLTGVLKPGGVIVLSGILESQWQEVAAAYPSIRFEPATTEEEWVRLVGRFRD